MSLQLTHTHNSSCLKKQTFPCSAVQHSPRVPEIPRFEGLGGHHSLGYQQLPNLRPAARELGQVCVFLTMPHMKSKEKNPNLHFGAFKQVFATSKCPRGFFKQISVKARNAQQIQPSSCFAQTCLDVKEKHGETTKCQCALTRLQRNRC